VEAVGDFAIYMLDPQGLVMSANPAAARIKGWRADEIQGRNFRRFFTPERAIAFDLNQDACRRMHDRLCSHERAERRCPLWSARRPRMCSRGACRTELKDVDGA